MLLFFKQETRAGTLRYRKYIENLKATNKYEEYKKKKAEETRKNYKKKVLERKKMTKEQQQIMIEKQRADTRERVMKHRYKKHFDGISNNSNTISERRRYTTSASLGKAVSKVRKSLPVSPNKKKEILSKLINDMDDNEKYQLLDSVSSKVSRLFPAKNVELSKKIFDFYHRDDVSRASPNMKDVKRFTNETTGQAEMRSIRHMLLTVKEAHAIFLEERECDGYYSSILVSIFILILIFIFILFLSFLNFHT